ncbi:MAG: hypothetical protein KIT84_11050 [Labilithrix sp.]|nr:hypothetical protein [Labilithrix sp.]MCW5811545.1 hypothetical protein [Labilithrix sp.]
MKKTTGTLTRAEVGKAFGKDKSWVIREEKAGRLKPVATGKRGARLYDEQEIRALIGGGPIERLPKALPYAPRAATSTAGISAQTAAKAIARLASGASKLEVLGEFELYPEQVEELDESRIRLQGGLSLTREHLEEIRLLLGMVRRPKAGDPAAFLRLMGNVASHLNCVRCSEGRASTCDDCVTRYARDSVAIAQARQANALRARDREQRDSRGRAMAADMRSAHKPPPYARAGNTATPPNVSVPTPSARSASEVRGETANRNDGERPAAGSTEAPAPPDNPGQPVHNAGASASAKRGTPGVADVDVSRGGPNQSLRAFFDDEVLALKQEREILERLLASSPLTEADRLELERERRERK